MSTINSMLISGQVQTVGGTNNAVTSSTSTSSSSITADVDIFPVGNSINPTNFVYDGQTVLMINSTLNPNANVVKAQYFDPVYGSMPPTLSSGMMVPNFADWNFDLVPSSYLNGTMSSSALLTEPTYLFSNLQPSTNALGSYTLDIVNGAAHTNSLGSSTETMFFSLTSQPYVTYQGDFYTTPGCNNIIPGYSSQNNSDNFLFTSNYYVQQKQEIIIVQLVFTVNGTNSLNANNLSSSNTTAAPTVSVIVYNKVISKEALASLASGSSSDNLKTKVYTAGPIPLQYIAGGAPFKPNTSCSSVNNNVPIIIAPGYNKLYATMPVVYVAPQSATVSGNTVYYPRYLNNGKDSNPGYIIDSYNPKINPNNTSTPSGGCPENPFGHFVIGVAYSSDYNTYQPGASIYAEILIKNIWRSPISIYQSYQAFSTNDMATKQVVLLFGKTFNGGTFLVTNSGTPISLIDNYAVTSLRNFMSIMRAVMTVYDGSVSLVDYFINPNVVQSINDLGANAQVLTLQPLLDGAIMNPQTVLTCPNMYYMLLKAPNTVNMTVDPTNQVVFGQNIGVTYFALPNSTLCTTGDCRYYNSDLNILGISNNEVMFGNSIYVGLNTINNQQFYTLLILPEALFNGNPQPTGPNQLWIYSTYSTLFYISTSANSSSQFIPQSATITSSGTSTGTASSFTITPTYGLSKLILSVQNTKII